MALNYEKKAYDVVLRFSLCEKYCYATYTVVGTTYSTDDTR